MSGRKQTLDAKYILSFIFRFLVVVFVGFALFGLIIIIFLNRNIGPTYLEGISALSQLRTQLPIILFITAFFQAIALSVIVLLLTLLWSHGVSGPLVRFKKHLREFGEGRLLQPPFTFRETDQLHSLAHAFSEAVTAQRERTVQASTLLVEAQRLIDECEALRKEEKDGTHKFKTNLEDLQKIYLQIKEIYSAKKSDL